MLAPNTHAPLRPLRGPLLIFVLCAATYTATLGSRIEGPSPDNHFVHLAKSWLSGQQGVVGNTPPGTNDWACFDDVGKGPCPPNQFRLEDDRYRWYVSFPPFPAAVILPAVAIWDTGLWDRLFWAIFAGLGPAMLYVLLRHLARSGRSGRSTRENLVLTGLFALGSVYYFVAVQGTVWFAAHTVAVPLIALYLLFSLDARYPVLAGLMLGLAFMTRATTAFLVPFFAIEAMRMARAPSATLPPNLPWWQSALHFVRTVDPARFMKRAVPFALPILAIGAVAMWMNHARFDDPFEFGHTYLQIRWRDRIEKWGLFNYHYLPKNLGIFLASLPWLSGTPPFVQVSRHGLALWVTTPQLWLTLWPRKRTVTMVALFVSVAVVMVLNLAYQNSGWVQFGYRFALDYLVLLFALLAMGGRRFGVGFYALCVFAVAINAFGALTFDRRHEYYDRDPTQRVVFQPD